MSRIHPAERLRSEVWPTGRIPVDIDLILEKMGVEIIPTANLRDQYPQLCAEMREHGLDPGSVPQENIRSYLASRIHRYFEVSDQVVEIRLRKSGIHPNY